MAKKYRKARFPHYIWEIVLRMTAQGYSCREIEGEMKARGVKIDHSTISRFLKAHPDLPVTLPIPSKRMMVERSITNIEGKDVHVSVLVNPQMQIVDFYVSDQAGVAEATHFFSQLEQQTILAQ